MINKGIIISKETREIVNGENGDLFRLGVEGENLQENLAFKFQDEFVNGTARVEITTQDGNKSYVMATKVIGAYILPVKSIITKHGLNEMQLVITQGENPEEIPIFKSKKFDFFISDSINAESEAPEEYPQWIDQANTKLNEIDEAIKETNNLDLDIEKENHVARITITKKDGTEEIVNIFDGEKGDKGDKGDTGEKGDVGERGPQGEKGVKGDTGPQGERGEKGEKGDKGDVGSKGDKGDKGDTGEQGPQGIPGPKGEQGLKGDTGSQGMQGPQGIQGPAGQNGEDGVDGFSPIANVSQSGDITTITITDKNGTTTESIDISNKLNKNKVKTVHSTTNGDVYDVSYINTMIGDIETLLGGI